LNEDHAYGAVIIAKGHLNASKYHLTQHNAALGIDIRSPNGSQLLAFFSIYARPSTNSIDDIFAPLFKALGDLTKHAR
jgi:hypothetical protein